MKTLFVFSLLFLSTHTLVAQGPGPQGLTQRMSATDVALPHPATRDSTARPSEWKKGAAIGIGVGVVAAVIGRLLIGGRFFCDSDCGFHPTLAFVGDLAFLGLIGGLIGSTIHHD